MDCISVGRLVEKIKAFLLLILMAMPVMAIADDWLSLGGGTIHFCQSCAYNDANMGLGLQHNVTPDLRALGGVYYNSYYKATFYAGAAYQPLQVGWMRFGVMAGAVTNYPNLKYPFMALPALSIEGDRMGVDILGVPSVGNHTGLISANLKYKL